MRENLVLNFNDLVKFLTKKVVSSKNKFYSQLEGKEGKEGKI